MYLYLKWKSSIRLHVCADIHMETELESAGLIFGLGCSLFLTSNDTEEV